MTADVITVSVPAGPALAGIAAWVAVRIALALIAWRKSLNAPARAKKAAAEAAK